MAVRIRLLAVLLVASVLVATSGFARALYVCHMTGKVGTACGCAHGKKQDSGGAPALRRADCCEIAATHVPPAVASDDPPATVHTPPPALAAVLEVPVPPRRPSEWADWNPARERGPPAGRTRLYLQNCTLLI